MDTSTQGQGSWKCTICGAKSFENRRCWVQQTSLHFNCSSWEKTVYLLGPGKSYIRHRSYCRKAQARITTRKKACTNCTKAKTRCDLAQPHCSRCVSKSVACVYDSPSISSAQGVAPSTPSLQLAFSQSSNRRVRPSMDALSLNETRLSTEVSVTESLSSLDFGQIIPQVPEPFSIKKIANGQFSLNRSFVLCTLKSYPRMFHLRDLPPFIHPYYAYGNNTPGCQSATTKYDQPPLQNCAVIIRWHFVADEDQVMYVWRTMRVELERLLTEVSYAPNVLKEKLFEASWHLDFIQYEDYTDQDILAALQATTIYLLLRVSQEKYDAENFDIQLIHTMIVRKTLFYLPSFLHVLITRCSNRKLQAK